MTVHCAPDPRPTPWLLPQRREVRERSAETVIEPAVQAGRAAQPASSHHAPECRSERVGRAVQGRLAEEAGRVQQLRELGPVG